MLHLQGFKAAAAAFMWCSFMQLFLWWSPQLRAIVSKLKTHEKARKSLKHILTTGCCQFVQTATFSQHWRWLAITKLEMTGATLNRRWACVVLVVDQWCWTAEIKKEVFLLTGPPGGPGGPGAPGLPGGPFNWDKERSENPFWQWHQADVHKSQRLFHIHLKWWAFVSRSCDTSNLFIPDRFMLLAVS